MQSCRAAPRLLGPPSRLAVLRSAWEPPRYQRRHFGLETVTAVLIPPAVFAGLLVSLWTYKCFMMVVFQNKIIYMPSVPPFSRSEKVADYAAQCRPVQWTEHGIQSKDGTKIKLLEGCIPAKDNPTNEVVVLYFQGNASSLPPRLPYLSRILSTIHNTTPAITGPSTKYTIIALSYRGFWTSKGRPSQSGIELDTSATIKWVLDRFPSTSQIIIWGQSIGAGAASVSLSNMLSSPDTPSKFNRISGLLLETPFIDLKTMLVALYPQKFLPYRYLAPFLMSSWDSRTALTKIGNTNPKLKVLLLQAGDDELVPDGNAEVLEKICRSNGLDVQCTIVKGALHTEVMAKSQGRMEIARFLRSFGDGKN